MDAQGAGLSRTGLDGLELPRADERFDNIFAAYEAPNYVAAKDDAVFEEVLARCGRKAGEVG